MNAVVSIIDFLGFEEVEFTLTAGLDLLGLRGLQQH